MTWFSLAVGVVRMTETVVAVPAPAIPTGTLLISLGKPG